MYAGTVNFSDLVITKENELKFKVSVEGTDDAAFYNNYVGGKFYRPVQEYFEHTC